MVDISRGLSHPKYASKAVALAACVIMLLMSGTGIAGTSNTINVPGDHATIQWAVDNATEGDTIYVSAGTYVENVMLDKAVRLVGIGMPDIDARSAGDAVNISADGCTVQGFHLTNFSGAFSGVAVCANDSAVRDNLIDYGYSAIYLENAGNNTIYNNTVADYIYYGILVRSSDQNVLDNNTIIKCSISGIQMESSGANVLKNNSCKDIGGGEVGVGIMILSPSAGNELYFNDLANMVNAYDDSPGNTWYNATIGRGNWYSDYAGADAGGDGVGDTPYDIMGYGAQDIYPLMPVEEPVEAAPAIIGPGNGTPTNNSVDIYWTTDIPSDNVVLYGLSEGLSGGSWSGWDNGTASPYIRLTGLSAGTKYYYRCHAYNPDNLSLYSTSDTLSFTTIRGSRTWTVDDNGAEMPGADFDNVQDAINASIDGDVIVVYSGFYPENITVNHTLTVSGVPDPATGKKPEIYGDTLNGSTVSLKSSGCVFENFNVTRKPAFVYYRDHDAGLSVGYTEYRYSGGAWHAWDYASDDNVVRDCNFTGCGIYIVKESDHNDIYRCNLSEMGITIQHAKYNRIFDCTLAGGARIEMIPLDTIDSFPYLYEEPFYNAVENNRLYDSEIEVERYVNDNRIIGNVIVFEALDDSVRGIEVFGNRNNVSGNVITGSELGTGIRLNCNDTLLANNSISTMDRGILIISQGGRGVNATMRDNEISDCNYNFLLDPGTYISYDRPRAENFDHDIDTSNTVNGYPIYFIEGASGASYDYFTLPDAGFLALVNCSNVTVSGLSFSKNSHGLLLFNVSDSRLEDVYATENYLDGIALYASRNVTVDGAQLVANGDLGSIGESYGGCGVLLAGCENVTVSGCVIDNNMGHGIDLDYSDGCEIAGSTIRDSGRTQNYGEAAGINAYGSNRTLIRRNNISATMGMRQKFGVYMAESVGGLVYDNYFDNEVDARETSYYAAGVNSWNATKAPGPNIVGGPYLGGNFWSAYDGNDTDGDGLGDTKVPYNASGGLAEGDHHPLVAVSDHEAPWLYVISPVENETYNATYVYLTVYSNSTDVRSWWYSLNGSENVTFTPDTTIENLTSASYTLTIYVNDTSGNWNSTSVNFTVNATVGGDGLLGEVPDEEVDFPLTIISPSSDTRNRSVSLEYASPYPLKRASYILDDDGPIALSPTNSTNLSRLSIGLHSLTLNGEDYYGLKGKAKVEFYVMPLTAFDAYGPGQYPDDVAYSIFGRTANYTLGFEARGEGGNVSVHVNRKLAGHIGTSPEIVDCSHAGMSPGNITLSEEWESHWLAIPAENITPDGENIVSFVHELNPYRNDSFSDWMIRNVTVRPGSVAAFPSIDVFTPAQAISGGESLVTYVSIDGIGENDSYSGYVYLTCPDGRKLYYPAWDEAEAAIDASIVRDNYYGRLPVELEFDDGFAPGTYVLTGGLVDDYTGAIDSLSAKKVYYNNNTSTRVYVNKELVSDGMSVAIENAVTAGPVEENASLVLSLEDPAGSRLYLPMMSPVAAETNYRPLGSDFMLAYEGVVDSSWANGTYVVRSTLYNDTGDIVSEDVRTFDVARGEALLTGRLLYNGSVPIVLSRIRLIDPVTMSAAEFENSSSGQTKYEIRADSGYYYLSGELFDAEGYAYLIKGRNVTLRPGVFNVYDLEAKRMGRVYEWGGDTSLSRDTGGADSPPEGQSSIKYLTLQDGGQCSPPKVVIYVSSDKVPKTPPLKSAYKRLLEDWPDTPYEDIIRYYELFAKERLSERSTGVELVTLSEYLGAYADQIENMEKDPDAAVQKPRYDYLYEVKIFNADNIHWTISDKIVDHDTLLVVDNHFEDSEYLEAKLGQIIAGQGDVGALLRAYEMTHPIPPRDPWIEVLVEPEAVSVLPGKNNTTIKALVFSCRGEAVSTQPYNPHRHEVYMQRNTDRGTVKGDWDGKGILRPDSFTFIKAEKIVICDTRDDGYALGKYTLTKGTEAGYDRVEITTFGRGKKRATATAMIRIYGMDIEAYADKPQVEPLENARVSVSLFEEDADGGRTPLAGKGVDIDMSGLLGGSIVYVGPTDGQGRPVTDQNGNMTFQYRSGSKEGRVKIPVSYTTEDGKLTVKEDVLIEVKADSWVVTIDWSEEETSSEATNYDRGGSYLYSGSTYDYSARGTYNYNYVFGFNSRSEYRGATDSEKTRATLRFVLWDEDVIQATTTITSDSGTYVGNDLWSSSLAYDASASQSRDGQGNTIASVSGAGSIPSVCITPVNIDMFPTGTADFTRNDLHTGSSGYVRIVSAESKNHLLTVEEWPGLGYYFAFKPHAFLLSRRIVYWPLVNDGTTRYLQVGSSSHTYGPGEMHPGELSIYQYIGTGNEWLRDYSVLSVDGVTFTKTGKNCYEYRHTVNDPMTYTYSFGQSTGYGYCSGDLSWQSTLTRDIRVTAVKR